MTNPAFSCYRLTFELHTLSLLPLFSQNAKRVTKDTFFIRVFYPNGSIRERGVRESNNITSRTFHKSS